MQTVIDLDPTSEIAELLRRADLEPIVFAVNGARYRVEAEDPFGDLTEDPFADPDPEELWADYDPDKVREGLRAAAGSLSDEEAEQLIEEIYRRREAGTRSADRWAIW